MPPLVVRFELVNRIERSIEWVISQWGAACVTYTWSDYRLIRALGLVISLIGILVVGAIVGVFLVVRLFQQKQCRAKNASRSATHRR